MKAYPLIVGVHVMGWASGLFKVVVKELGCSYFYSDDGSTKFPFS